MHPKKHTGAVPLVFLGQLSQPPPAVPGAFGATAPEKSMVHSSSHVQNLLGSRTFIGGNEYWHQTSLQELRSFRLGDSYRCCTCSRTLCTAFASVETRATRRDHWWRNLHCMGRKGRQPSGPPIHPQVAATAAPIRCAILPPIGLDKLHRADRKPYGSAPEEVSENSQPTCVQGGLRFPCAVIQCVSYESSISSPFVASLSSKTSSTMACWSD